MIAFKHLALATVLTFSSVAQARVNAEGLSASQTGTTLTLNGGSLTGLGNQTGTTMEFTADVNYVVGCYNPGGNKPPGQQKFTQPASSGVHNIQSSNGQYTIPAGQFSITAAEPPRLCKDNFEQRTESISFSNAELHVTTPNGRTTTFDVPIN